MKINHGFLDLKDSYLFSTIAKKVNAYKAANPDADIMSLISYMDDEWPCTRVIKADIASKIEAARKDVVAQRSGAPRRSRAARPNTRRTVCRGPAPPG